MLTFYDLVIENRAFMQMSMEARASFCNFHKNKTGIMLKVFEAKGKLNLRRRICSQDINFELLTKKISPVFVSNFLLRLFFALK
jgi:hypothetical protein